MPPLRLHEFESFPWAALNDGLDIAWNAIIRPSEAEGSEVNQMVSELTSWIRHLKKSENS